MDRLADRIDQAAATLATMDRRVPELLPAAAAFGADDDAGRPGRTGQRLHETLAAALRARAGEAAALSGQLSDLAHAVRAGSRDYAEADAVVRHRFLRGL